MSVLVRIVTLVARLAPPRHRDLMRGMVAELESIAGPAERARFALGAVAAIARLVLSGLGRWVVHAPSGFGEPGGPMDGSNRRESPMPKLSTRALLLRLGTAFALSLASLTVLLFAREASRWIPQLSARGAPGSAIAEAMVMTLPHTLALTFPMAVFLAVSWVLARLGTEGRLAEARRDPRELRRMMRPVLVAAAAVAVFTSVWNAEMLPRANARLVAVLVGAPVAPTDRTMTIAELSAAAERVRATRGPSGEARAAAYEVELHKKFALGAACMFLALLAAATSIRFPRGGLGLVLGTSPVVFAVYWLVAVAGEYLADELLLSPFVAMWLANAVLLVVALLLVRRPSPPENMRGAEALAIDP